MTNLVSFTKLKQKGIFWNTEKNYLYGAIDQSIICSLQEIAGQQVINNRLIAYQAGNSAPFEFLFVCSATSTWGDFLMEFDSIKAKKDKAKLVLAFPASDILKHSQLLSIKRPLPRFWI